MVLLPEDTGLTSPPPAPDRRDTTLPLGARGQYVGREAFEDDLARGNARPLTDEEQQALEEAPGPRPRVYAPASQRVPRPPRPGDRELVERGLREEG